MTRNDFLECESKRFCKTGYKVTINYRLGHVAIDKTGEVTEIFLQGDEGISFIRRMIQLWEDENINLTLDEMSQALAMRYLDVLI
jgi:hypothetical protein